VKLAANDLVAFVALCHVGFLVLEMFFWNHAVGERVFGLPRDVLASSATLAANQGLYNGFLAAGLVWGLIAARHDVKLFFLICVVIAGVFGTFTAKFSILYTQALPALIALAAVLMAKKPQEPDRVTRVIKIAGFGTEEWERFKAFQRASYTVLGEIRALGYENCHRKHIGAVLAHRVTCVPDRWINRRRIWVWECSRSPSSSPSPSPPSAGAATALPTGATGAVPSIRRHKALWTVEPHLGFHGIGAKFEEILVVTERDAYWLDDTELPHHAAWRSA